MHWLIQDWSPGFFQHEIEVLENTEGLTPLNALKILKRVMGFADLFILANSSSFAELEQEKNMPTGGIVRQCLRLGTSSRLSQWISHPILILLAMTTAVRHCMECRFQRFDPTVAPKPPSTPASAKTPSKDPIESILEMTYLMNAPNENEVDHTIEGLLASFIRNPQSVLQELDIQRLRAIIYRDVVRQDRNKNGKNVVLVVVNFRISFLTLLFVCTSVFADCSSFVSLIWLTNVCVYLGWYQTIAISLLGHHLFYIGVDGLTLSWYHRSESALSVANTLVCQHDDQFPKWFVITTDAHQWSHSVYLQVLRWMAMPIQQAPMVSVLSLHLWRRAAYDWSLSRQFTLCTLPRYV